MARTVPVTLTANVTPFTSAMANAAKSVKEVDAAVDKATSGSQWGNAAQSAKRAAEQQKKALADVKRAQQEASQAQGQLWDKSAKGLLALGAGVTALSVLAVKGAADFDSAMSMVKATGEDAASNIDSLRTAAMEAGEEFGQFSATDAALGIEALAKAGVDAKDVLGGGLQGALALAASGNLDVAGSAEAAATALNQFNLEGKDASHVADLLAAGAGKAMGEVSDISQALNQSGLVAAQYGLSIEETVGSLAAFAQAGLVGSDAGTSFKTMLQRLGAPTKEAQRELDRLGVSVYDTDGNFRSMSEIAEELRTGMSGLDETTRNAAMSTIFGSDAIRAANVLYSQGAKGIEEWTAKVDDQGYAMEVASVKMDNLKGDWAELQGTLETTFIDQGSGANAGLRELVQSLTGIVEAFNDMPSDKQAMLVKTIVGLGAGALAAGAIIKTARAISEVADMARTAGPALDFFTASFGRNEIATKNMVSSLKGAGLAIAAFAAAASIGMLVPDSSTASVEAFSRTLEGLSSNATTAKAELDGIAAAGVSNWGYKDKVEDLDDLFGVLAKTGGLTKSIDKIGLALDDLTGIDIPTQWGTATKQIESMDEALSSLDPKKSTAALKEISNSATQAGLSADQLAESMPKTFEAMRKAGAESGRFGLSNQEIADWMGGRVPEASDRMASGLMRVAGEMEKTSEAARKSGSAGQGLVAPWDGAARAMERATEAAYENIEALRKQAEGALDASNSNIATERAILNGNKAVKEANDTLAKAKKGSYEYESALLSKREAINQTAQAWMRERADMEKNTATASQVAKRQEEVRGEINKTAKAAGMHADEIAKMNKEYGLTPETVVTKVEVKGADKAKKDAEEFNARLAALPPSTQSTIISVWKSGDFDRAMRMLAEADGKRIITYVQTVWEDTRKSLPSMPGLPQTYRAAGGLVRGPGTTTSDSIHAMLSDKEYVIKADSASRLGVARLDYINRHGKLPAFATGGLVGPNGAVLDRMPTPAAASMQSNFAASFTINEVAHPALTAAYIERGLRGMVA